MRPKRPYRQDPLTGESRTRDFVDGFLEAFSSPTDERKSICGTLLGAMPAPLEVLYPTKTKNPVKRYIGRAASVLAGSNGDEALWCELADVSKACFGLTEEQREVLFLKYIRDLPYQEIADLLGVPVSDVFDLVSSSIDHITAALDGERVVLT